MAGDEDHDTEVRTSAEAAEGEPSSSGRDVVELSDGEDEAAARAPGARRETRGTKRRAACDVDLLVDLTGDSDSDEPPAEVQFVTVMDSPPRPPPALLSHINCAICMDAVGAKELASTVCGHVFCWSCIQESLKARKKCPTCRGALNPARHAGAQALRVT